MGTITPSQRARCKICMEREIETIEQSPKCVRLSFTLFQQLNRCVFYIQFY
jgi:hypothetical protein